MIRTAKVTLTGKTGLIMHRMDQDWLDRIREWQKAPLNKGRSKAGDDRYPAYLWMGYVYHDGKQVGIPSDNLMTCLREGATKVGTGQGKETFKKLSQSGIIVMDPLTPLKTVHGTYVDWKNLTPLLANEGEFSKHEESVLENGFNFIKKSVRIAKARHYRIRPFFEAGWSVEVTMVVTDDLITDAVFQTILDCAGRFAGLGDWRPSSPASPGAYGQFTSRIEWIDSI